MSSRAKLFAALTFAALAVTGCEAPEGRKPAVRFEEQTISIQDLAVRLDLRVEETEETFVVLRNAANTVLIFTHSGARFFVNGEPIGPVGAVKRVGDTVYVPEALVSQIRPHLGISAPERPPVVTPRRSGIVVIDAGHGGDDPGAIGPGGVYEKNINLQVATKVAALLQRSGLNVTMTRRRDRFIELEDRAEIANRRNADLFVSIHADSAPNPNASGFTLYIANAASSQAYRAARAISRAMAGTGTENRGIRREDYRVLVRTDGPAVLIELGYLSNARDAARLRDSRFQGRLAAAIAAGIADYLR